MGSNLGNERGNGYPFSIFSVLMVSTYIEAMMHILVSMQCNPISVCHILCAETVLVQVGIELKYASLR